MLAVVRVSARTPLRSTTPTLCERLSLLLLPAQYDASHQLPQTEMGEDAWGPVTAMMGHSVGEYSAAAAAGSLSVADAARLLRLRGQAMQRAADAFSKVRATMRMRYRKLHYLRFNGVPPVRMHVPAAGKPSTALHASPAFTKAKGRAARRRASHHFINRCLRAGRWNSQRGKH